MQTGKRYFKHETYLKNREGSDAPDGDDDIRNLLMNQGGLAGTMIGGPQLNLGSSDVLADWERDKKVIVDQMNSKYNSNEKSLMPQTQEELQVQMQACESFSREVFTSIVKSLVQDKLYPKIKTVVGAYMT